MIDSWNCLLPVPTKIMIRLAEHDKDSKYKNLCYFIMQTRVKNN